MAILFHILKIHLTNYLKRFDFISGSQKIKLFSIKCCSKNQSVVKLIELVKNKVYFSLRCEKPCEVKGVRDFYEQSI